MLDLLLNDCRIYTKYMNTPTPYQTRPCPKIETIQSIWSSHMLCKQKSLPKTIAVQFLRRLT